MKDIRYQKLLTADQSKFDADGHQRDGWAAVLFSLQNVFKVAKVQTSSLRILTVFPL
jgi:hypothetical protein